MKRTLTWKLILAGLAITVLSGFLILLAVGWAYMRSATRLISEVPSPDGKWHALLMVRNGGAMTDYTTQVSLVNDASLIAREKALCSPGNVFIADANHGMVPVNQSGLMHVEVEWVSPAELLILYPSEARVFKEEPHFKSLNVTYKK